MPYGCPGDCRRKSKIQLVFREDFSGFIRTSLRLTPSSPYPDMVMRSRGAGGVVAMGMAFWFSLNLIGLTNC